MMNSITQMKNIVTQSCTRSLVAKVFDYKQAKHLASTEWIASWDK